MGDIVTDNALGLRAAQDRIKITQLNIAKSKVANAHRVDPVTSYDGKTNRIDVSLNRATDPHLENLFNSSITKANNTNAVTNSLLSLQSYISDPSDKTKSNIVGQIEKFINTAKQIITTPSTPLKQNFVNKGESLAGTLSDASNKILNLRLEADSDISDALTSVNGYILQLFNLNIAMSGDSKSNELLDQRDNLISKIAEFFDIKVSFGNNNNALVSTANGSFNLVDSTTYAKFNYDKISHIESFLLEVPDINSITMDIMDIAGRPIGNLKVVEGSDSSISKISGGKIGGYIKLRDDVLPKANMAITSLSSQVMNTVNAIHNKYSPFPPKTTYTSAKEMRYNDPLNWSNKLTIAAITKDGKFLEGYENGGAIRPITIDFSSLPSRTPSGSVTTADLINEINSFLNVGPADNRIALGRITEVNSNPLLPPPAPTYLLNNIKIAGMSDISDTGNFSFDLELDGSKYYGSTVEILSVTSPAGDAYNLPSSFELKKGQHVRTNQQITVGGIAGGPSDIDVRIRVIGDNGLMEEGTARFTINPVLPGGTKMINKRVVGTRPLIGAGAMVDVGDATYAPIAVAKLVDENGVDVPLDSGLPGKLAIQAFNSNNGLLINSDQDDSFNGFSNLFGLNNFFVDGDIAGTFKVNPEITANPLLLSTGMARASSSLQTVQQGSGVAASATIFFSQAPNTNDTITIGNITFTMVAALTGAPNQVLRDATSSICYTNLVNAINQHKELSSILQAEFNLPGNLITINSKLLGTSSNNVPIAVNLNGGRVADITPRGGAPTATSASPASTLGGGTDSAVQIEKFALIFGDEATDFFSDIEQLQSKLWDFEANSFVPASKNSIFGYSKFVTELLSNQLIAARADSQIAQTVKDNLATKLQDTVGISKDNEIIKLSEFAQSLSAVIAISSLVSNLFREAINTLKVN